MRAIYRAKIVIREFYLGLLLPLSGFSIFFTYLIYTII